MCHNRVLILFLLIITGGGFAALLLDNLTPAFELMHAAEARVPPDGLTLTWDSG
jgi:hypothetical protein